MSGSQVIEAASVSSPAGRFGFFDDTSVHRNKWCPPMPPEVSLKSVTNKISWSALSKTSTFGLKFVAVPVRFSSTHQGTRVASM